MMTSGEIREAFLKFFEERGHTRVPSDSLVPSNDPTLLFTVAGMVQFKPYYVAADKPFSRATSSQKCLRTADIDQVGVTSRHLTFFEMLGNFSFGDYFKEETIAFAWEFLTRVARLDPKLLHITIFKGDDEAEKLWLKFMPRDRILRFGDEDNYWPAGSVLPTWVGPNGPCSEIYYDFGPEQCRKAGHAKSCSAPGEHECDRFLEIWNLVFPQYIRSLDGKNSPMTKPGVDTGMGMERMVPAMQGKTSFYETDLFEPLIDHSRTLLPFKQGQLSSEIARARQILADHARSAVFLVNDGVVPSNEGRGYVLRRIIRRAVRQSALFGEARPVVSEMLSTVVKVMGEAYPEIGERRREIKSTILTEENAFIEALQRGLEELQKEKRSGRRTLDGERAFYFYDTFGFPRELTEDIWVREMKLELSGKFEAEYEKALGEQQQKARAAWKGSGETGLSETHRTLARELGASRFVGHENFEAQTRVLALVKEGERVAEIGEGVTAEAVLDSTPLYAESGGQAADRGLLAGEDCQAEVLDVQKPLEGMFLHRVLVKKGKLREGDGITARVEMGRRMATARHHTATHLMHRALQGIVGRGATQAGSYVGPDYLRFDFMSQKALEPAKLKMIEDEVNARIMENLPVSTSEVTIEEAKKKGAQMLFGEKYGSRARMLEVSDYSRELCGGTHVTATSVIGLFVLVSESAVAAGVRRITALAGMPAYEFLRNHRTGLERIASALKCPASEVEARLAKLQQGQRELEDSVRELKGRLAGQGLSDRLSGADKIGGVPVLITEAEAGEPAVLRELADRAMDQLKGGIVVLGSRSEDKCQLLVRVSPELTGRVKANEVVSAAAEAVGGKGGGKSEMAQAGGKNPAGLAEALERARAFLARSLG